MRSVKTMDQILLTRISKKSAVVLAVIAAAAALVDWRTLPAGIIIVGALGLANIKGLAWGVRGLLGTGHASGKMLFFSQFRLLMLFLILAALFYLRIVTVFGVLIGFTVVFIFTLIEGLLLSKNPPGDAA